MIAKKEIIRLAQERINELDNGNYLVDVNISSKNAIKVKMDNLHGGVSVKDCVSVSRNIEHNLDRDQEDFELQVFFPRIRPTIYGSSAILEKCWTKCNGYYRK